METKVHKAYGLKCQFRRYSPDNGFKIVKFLFENQLFERDENGYWNYNENLRTEEAFNDFRVDTMPDPYQTVVR